MTFEEELTTLLRSNLEFEDLQAEVLKLHRRYDREVPPEIAGTVSVVEPEDGFGGG